VEVKEINVQNNGMYPFPMLLKKQKLSKAPILTHCPGMSLKEEQYLILKSSDLFLILTQPS